MKRIQFALLVGLLIALIGLLGFKGFINEANAQAVNVQINFQEQTTPVPAGYLRDFGEPYGLRTGANQGGGTLTYGWVAAGTSTACNIVGAGRLRLTPPAQTVLLRSLMHMEFMQSQLCGLEGSAWEIAVPNGFYDIEVAVGDSEWASIGDLHRINAEGIAVINFAPPAPNVFDIQTATVLVSDGRLTVDSIGGTNTKINYIHIVSGSAPGNPQVLGTNVANGATGVSIGTSITTTTIYFPDPNAKVNTATVNDSTVFLYETAAGAGIGTISGEPNVAGDGLAITWVNTSSTTLLTPFTNYTFEITGGVQDQNGTPFIPYTISFTTGSSGTVTTGPAGVEFTKVATGVTQRAYTSLVIGPDGRLYATSYFGGIYHWDIDPATGNLSNERQITNYLNSRMTIGLAFDPASTAANPVMWITHTELDQTGTFVAGNNFTGAVARLTGSNVGTVSENWVVQELIYGLPRSNKDHLTNSLAFGPDGAVYVSQGGVSAMGEWDTAWGEEPETLLSAAILRIDRGRLFDGRPLPVPVATGSAFVPSRFNVQDILVNCGFGDFGSAPCNGFYNPQAPNAPVTIYASGVRNAYDLVWHSNNRLYSATNGSRSSGSSLLVRDAAVPVTPPVLPNACNFRLDAGFNGPWTIPPESQVFPIEAPIPTQPDYFYRIVQNGYYGHPNPTRCEWVQNGGNPTPLNDPEQNGNHYPLGTIPDRNWRPGFNLGIGNSANGTIEYRNGAVFGGALQGKLLTTWFAIGKIAVSSLGGPTNDIVLVEQGAPGLSGFTGPLDLVERVSTGQLYVIEFFQSSLSGQITRLDPVSTTTGPNIVVTPTSHLFEAINNGTQQRTITIQNTGGATLNVTNITTIGPNPGDFSPSATVLTIPAGGSQNVTITFAPTTIGVKVADLQITSTDPDTPNAFVELRGLSKLGNGGANEPSLQWILDTFNIGEGDTVGDDDPATTDIHSIEAIAAGPPFGDGVDIQRFVAANPANPVELEVLAIYGFSGSSSIVSRVGWYPSSNPATKNEVFVVPDSTEQTIFPNIGMGPGVRTVTFNPGSQPFGFYGIFPGFTPPSTGREVYSLSSLNMWESDPEQRLKVRVYPYIDSAGNPVPDAYIIAFEEFNTAFDSNDIVFIARNVRQAPITLGGDIRFENLDWTTLNTQNIAELDYLNRWLTFHRILNGAPNRGGTMLFHDEVTLAIHNDHPTESLLITGLTISDTTEFILPDGENPSPGAPLAVDPGSFRTVRVRFVEVNGAPGVRIQTLTVTSSDSSEPTAVITLAGGYMAFDEGAGELNTNQIRDAFGFQHDMGASLTLERDYASAPVGDEVVSDTWRRADPTKQVYARQLAAFHGCCVDPVQFQITGTGGANFRQNPSYGQTFLPPIQGSNVNPAQYLGNPTGNPFQVIIAGFNSNHFQNDNDINGVFVDANYLAVRFWQVRNSAGALVPNAYWVMQDYVDFDTGFCHDNPSNGLCDYNDNVFLITNIEPAALINPTDIAVTITESSDPAPVSANFTLTVNVENVSLFTAANNQLSITLPAQYTLVSATVQGGGGTCNTANPIICTLGTIAAETTKTVDVVVTTPSIGTFTTIASATTSTNESTTANNTASEDTTVLNSGTIPGTVTIVKNADVKGLQVFNFTGDLGAFQLVDDGSSSSSLSFQYNFQPAASPVPAGYIADTGAAYGVKPDGQTYGWLRVSDNTPFDSAGGMRERTRAVPPELNTIQHMNRGAVQSTGFTEHIYWEHALPNGNYSVTVSVGDEPVYDSTNTIRAEGQILINGFVGAGPAGGINEYREATATVTVADGRLTIDQIGGNNTKIDYIMISSEAQPNSRTFNNVIPGVFNVTETIPVGWSLGGVVCTGGTTTPIVNGVSITVGDAQNITCTFNNVNASGNAIPVATPDSYTIAEDQTLGVNAATGVLSNDTDADPGDTLSSTVITNVTNGTLTLNLNGSFSYTPNPNFNGTDTFTYQASDGRGGTAQALVTITVTLVNDVPVANDDSATTPANTAVNISVMTNDSDADFVSPPLDPANADITIVSPPANGNVVVDNVTGIVSYTPLAGFTGSDTFTYNLTDAASAVSNNAIVTVVVSGVPSISLNVVPSTQSVTTGSPASLTLNVDNSGSVPLTTINFTQSTCDTGPTFVSGDANTDNILDTTETWVYTCDFASVTAPLNLTYEVAGTEPLASIVTATDTATITVDSATMTITPDPLNFGGVVIGSAPVIQTLTIQNTGVSPLNITAVAISGANAGEFSVAPLGAPVPLAAGATTTIDVTYTSTIVGPVTASLDVTHDGINGPTTSAILQGTGTSAPIGILAVTPNPVAFGSSVIGTPVTLPVTLQNTGAAPVNISAIAISGANPAAFVAGAPGATTLAAGATTTVDVTFTPTSAGGFAASLDVTHDGSNGPTTSTVLQGTGTSAPVGTLAVTPNPVAFGSVVVGSAPVVLPVTLENTGAADVIVSAVAISGANAGEFSVAPLVAPVPLAAGATTTVDVTYTATIVGPVTASLDVTHDGSNGPTTSTVLQGTGTSAPVGILLITPNPVVYGDVNVGGGGITLPVTLQNTGSASLDITTIAISGANPAAFVAGAPGGATLAPNASTTVNVTFTPPSVGAFAASLDVTHTGDNGPVTSTALQGAGVQGILTALVDPFNFGMVPNGGLLTLNVRIRNDGNGDLNISALGITGPNAGEFSVPALPGILTVVPGQTQNIAVTFSPTALGAMSATLEFAHDGSNGPVSTNALQGEGVDPTLAILLISPTTVDFGQININTAAPLQQLTLTNIGGPGAPAINIASAIITGANGPLFSHDFTGGTPIVVGTPQVINVGFIPSSVGVFGATVEILHDAVNGPLATVAVSGEGVDNSNPTPPPSTQPPTTVAANIVAIDPFITKNANPPFALPGEHVTFTFVISNPGSAPATSVQAIDPMPAEVEILSATAPVGTVTVNGQQVLFEIPVLGPGESVTVTIESRVRDTVRTPFVITNEVCMQTGSPAAQGCSSATVLSVTALPQTGETPLWSIILRYIVAFVGGVGAISVLGWATLKIRSR